MPAPAEELRMSPANTRCTASASGTRATVMSASSCSTTKPSGRSAACSPSARKTCTSSSLNPGELLTETSSDQRSAASCTSSASSRLAVGVPEAGGQLPEVLPDGVAVLPQQDDVVVVVQREHRHRPGVVHDLPD